MKAMLAALMIALVANAARAQDARGRQRQPPGHGTNTGSGTSPRGGGSEGGAGSEGGTTVPARRDEPATHQPSFYPGGGSRNGGSRSIPRPDGRTLNGSRGEPNAGPPPDSGLGHAVRRDSLPGGAQTGHYGDLDPRGYDERGRGQYYWHDHRGRRWCHYIDGYGVDWYYWYEDDGYYTMRYIDGHWWRYDARYGRWVYLYDGGWYYADGPTVYRSEPVSGGYGSIDEGSWSMPTTKPRKLEIGANLGYFGLNNGGAGSVIKENSGYLDFDGRRMSGTAAGVELNVGVNNYLEAGVGVGYQKGSVDSRYREYVRDDGSEIRQNLTATNIPMDVNVKIVPFGRDKVLQPYVGGGIQVNKWQYQERGQFIDFNSPNYDIYKDTYKAGGVAAGPVLIGGLKMALNDDVAIVGEYRRQWARGDLPKDGGFAGDHIDMGGSSIRAGVTIRLK